jgi:phage gp36-like protein
MATLYATPADFRNHFGENETSQVTDFDNEGSENGAALLLALKDATDELNSYLASKYSLPLAASAVISPLTRAACDVARYRLYKDRPTEEVALRYKNTIAYLKDLANGTARVLFDPPLTTEEVAASEVPAVAYGTYTGGVFGANVLAGQPGIPQWPL